MGFEHILKVVGSAAPTPSTYTYTVAISLLQTYLYKLPDQIIVDLSMGFLKAVVQRQFIVLTRLARQFNALFNGIVAKFYQLPDDRASCRLRETLSSVKAINSDEPTNRVILYYYYIYIFFFFFFTILP